MLDADQQTSRPGLPRRRLTAILLLITLVVYLIFLIVSMPARFVLNATSLQDEAVSVSGTVWEGNAALANGHVVDWQTQPLQSLISISLVADIRLSGAQTALTGKAALRGGGVKLRDATGRAGWALVASLSDSLDDSCDIEARIDIDRLDIGNNGYAFAGSARSAEGICRIEGGQVIIPPLSLASVENDGRSVLTVTEVNRPDTVLISGEITREGLLSLSVTEEGAALLPGRPGGPASLEMEL